MTSPRRLAIAAGVCYLVTHVTSVAALALYSPALKDAAWIAGHGTDGRVLLGAFLEVFLAFAVVGTAVALYPVVRRQNEAVALGYVTLRTLEAGIIVVDIAALLAAVTLRRHLAGAAGPDPAPWVAAGRAVLALHDWTFMLGPSFTSGTNTVLLAWLMYRARLVPRFIPVLGLLGGPLVFASVTGVLFGLYGQYTAVPAVAALPEFAWEVCLAVYLIVWGFRPSSSVMRAIAAEPPSGGAEPAT